MGKKKGILATVAVPAILLAGGAGIGLVVAKEPTPRESQEGRAAASAELVDQLRKAAKTESAREAVRKKRKRPAKKMTIPLAEKNAEGSAYRTWLNDWDDTDWDEYGTGDCNRLSRSSVTCLAWVDWIENGYGDSDYESTYTCEWWVTSRWERKAKRGKKVRYALKVTDGRGRAVCEYD